MCGIAGKLNFVDQPVSVALLRAMCEAIAHRGPDDQGMYLNGKIGMGNRRLSIIDVAGGHQPIANEDETVWIVFNGEIYNFPELRAQLLARGHVLRTRSDTEVIVHLYEDEGPACLERLNGMFAFALWDTKLERLMLARDRLGEKPLLYAVTADGLVFGSEMSALLQDPAVQREIDLDALDLYLALQYVPNPRTMLRGVHKLPPAHYLLWQGGRLDVQRYWDVDFTPRWKGSESEAVAAIRELLEDSVRRRLMSEVPLGAFLSGGVDSSTMVALMTRLTGKPVKTFSVGFDGDAYGELPFAREIARRYQTEHHELDVRPQMIDVLPKLVHHFGEPFGDCSAVPTYYVSKLAAGTVKVAMSGDGGDEVFAGYPWYVDAFRPGRLAAAFLGEGARAARQAIARRQPRRVLGAVKGVAVGLGESWRVRRSALGAFERAATCFTAAQRSRLYTSDVRNGRPQLRIDPIGERYWAAQNGTSPLSRLMYTDHHLYLPDDILVKVDITTMACSLEARAPFLDHRLVELVASMPATWKVRGGVAKHLLKRAVADLLPETVLKRPKVGFALPVQRWMREDLRDMACDLLLDPHARYRMVLEPRVVGEMLTQHMAAARPNGYQLWLLLFFELWCRDVLSVPAPTFAA